MGERGREAPKSMRMLELIEASANMCRNELECVYMPECSSLLGRGPPPLFIGTRRGGLQVRGVPDVVLLSKNWGEQLVVPVAVHCEVWPRAWLSSLEAFDHAGNVYLSCGVCGRRGNSCRARCPLCLTGRSAEGASDDGLVLVNSLPCPRVAAHVRRGSCRGGSTMVWQHSGGSSASHVRAGHGKPAQRREWWHSDRS